MSRPGRIVFHLFFTCPISANIWSRLPNVQVPTTGDLEEWRSSLQSNIKQSKVVSGGYSNSVLNLVILWKIWIARNKKVFDDINPDPDIIYRQCLVFSAENANTFIDNFQLSTCQAKLIAWKFPGTGKLKLNTDGSSRGNPGPAGFGGVFREERGHWVLGFYGRLADCSSI